MDITGIWKYDELKKQYNAVAAELDEVKKTATQLTNENNDLKRELDRLGDDYQEYRRRAFEDLSIKAIKVNMKLDKAEARIKELEAKVSQPKWCYHLNLGWIPIEGTAYQILSKTPAVFPQFCKEKRVPEK